MSVILSLVSGCTTSAPPFPTLPAWDHFERDEPALEPDERELWDDAEEALARLVESKAYFRDEGLDRYLQLVVAKVTPPIAEGGPGIRVHVNTDAENNASALPDGTIVIALGLLATLENEAQLAFVLAHEISHVMRRHVLLSQRYAALTSSHVERMRLSRQLEGEADRDAIRLIAQAGYDSREAVPALTHVVESGPGTRQSVHAWNSHDDLPRRLYVIHRAIEDREHEGGEQRAEPFEEAIDCCRLQAAALELEADRFDDALAIVTHHLERQPRSGAAFALRAQITRRKDPAASFSEAVGTDLERAVEYGPNDPDSLRALGLFLRDTGNPKRSHEMLRRYLEARPDAYDRKLIERYLDPTPGVSQSRRSTRNQRLPRSFATNGVST